MQPVFEAKLDGIHLDFIRKLVHHRFDGKMTFSIGAPSVGSGAGPVSSHGVNFPFHVGTLMIEVHGPRTDGKGDILSQTSVGPVTVVEKSANLECRERTISLRSGFDIVSERRPV